MLSEDLKLDDCHNIGMCSVTCPKGLDPRTSLQTLIAMVKEMKQNKVSENTLWEILYTINWYIDWYKYILIYF